jgi:hypothetical protein
MADIKNFTNTVLNISHCFDVYFNIHDFLEFTLLQSSGGWLSLQER